MALRNAGSSLKEGSNAKAVRKLMIGLAAAVVLVVSGYGTVIYIQLMGKVFPSGGPLLIACYMGAAANLLLMLVLLVGKFFWFRPGAHEVASWIVTGVELLVAILNMMLAFELASGQQLTSLMAAWYALAPISPVFSMVGAIILLMTSTELRSKHKLLEMQEEAEESEHQFALAMHRAKMEVKGQYLGFVKTMLAAELNAPERQQEMSNHASMLVSDVLSGISGLASTPRLSAPQFPNERTISAGLPALSYRATAQPARLAQMGDLSDDAWLAEVNQRIEAERVQRLEREEAAEPKEGTEPLSFADRSSDEAPSDEEGVVNEAVRKVLQLVQEVGLTGLSYCQPIRERSEQGGDAAKKN